MVCLSVDPENVSELTRRSCMPRILVGDDDEIFVTRLRTALGGIRCQTAQTAEQALARLEVDNYDVVLTDISMPGLSGLERWVMCVRNILILPSLLFPVLAIRNMRRV